MPDCRVHSIEGGGTLLAVPLITPAPDRASGPVTHLVELGSTTASPPAADGTR